MNLGLRGLGLHSRFRCLEEEASAPQPRCRLRSHKASIPNLREGHAGEDSARLNCAQLDKHMALRLRGVAPMRLQRKTARRLGIKERPHENAEDFRQQR